MSGYFSGISWIDGRCWRENPVPPASPAFPLAPFPINMFSGCCERGNAYVFAITRLSHLPPRVYIHQYVFWEVRAWEQLFFCHHAAFPPSSPRLYPSIYFLGGASVGTSIFLPSRAFPAFLPASISINIFSGGCERGNIYFFAITRLSRLPPRVYIHQYIFWEVRAWEPFIIGHPAASPASVCRVPSLPPHIPPVPLPRIFRLHIIYYILYNKYNIHCTAEKAKIEKLNRNFFLKSGKIRIE